MDADRSGTSSIDPLSPSIDFETDRIDTKSISIVSYEVPRNFPQVSAFVDKKYSFSFALMSTSPVFISPLILNTVDRGLINSFDVYRLAKPSYFNNCGSMNDSIFITVVCTTSIFPQ